MFRYQVSLSDLSLQDPSRAGHSWRLAAAALTPPVVRVALWLGPLLAVGWAIASGLGRSAVLHAPGPGAAPGSA